MRLHGATRLVFKGFASTDSIGELYKKHCVHGVCSVHGAQVLSVDHFGEVSWKKVTRIEKHDGENMVRITTRSGRQIVCSRRSLVLTRDLEYDHVDIGDHIPIVGTPVKKKYGIKVQAVIAAAMYTGGKLEYRCVHMPHRILRFVKLRAILKEFPGTYRENAREIIFSSESLYYFCEHLLHVGFPWYFMQLSKEACIAFCRCMVSAGTVATYICIPCAPIVRDGFATLLLTLGINAKLSEHGVMISKEQKYALNNPDFRENLHGDPVVRIEPLPPTTAYSLKINLGESVVSLNSICV